MSYNHVIVAAQDHGISSRIFGAQIPQTRRLVLASGDKQVIIRADRHSCYRPSGPS
jgi:hypothetical protein